MCNTLTTKKVKKSTHPHSTKYFSLKFTKSHASDAILVEGSGENNSKGSILFTERFFHKILQLYAVYKFCNNAT
jgi:hypothetical protein